MSVARRATLPRGERLRGALEFRQVFRRAARLERASFVLLWMPAAGRRMVAFAASRRLGSSVFRNRARRRLREAYRRHKGLLPESGLRLCFVARRRAGEAPFAELTAEVREAMGSAARRLGS